MDLNLWFNPNLLDKTRQKAADAREADRPFVPQTLASSTISPSGISPSPFSSPTYTNATSPSRPLVEQQGAGGTFSRGGYSTSENQAAQNAGTGSSSVTVTRVTAGGGSTSDLMGLSPEQPNRLTPTSPQGIVWSMLWEYASSFPTNNDSGLNSRYTFNIPVGFYEGFDLEDAVVNSPSADYDFGTDNAETIFSWSTTYDATEYPKRIDAPFSTYGVEIPLARDNEGFSGTTASAGSCSVIYTLDTSPELITTGTNALVLNGTLQADIFSSRTSDGINDSQQLVQLALGGLDEDGVTIWQVIAVISLGVYVPGDEEYAHRVYYGCLYDGTGDVDDYRVGQLLPNGIFGWHRASITIDGTVAYAHFDGKYIGSCSMGTLENVTGRRLVLINRSDNFVVENVPLKNAILGSVTFTDEILYDQTDYTVTSLLG